MKRGVSIALAIVLVVAPVLPDMATADDATPAVTEPAAGADADTFNTEQLDALLAPIALYPDVLLTQVLMASTFPLEIVQASRWLQDPAHKDLKGDALAKALEEQSWDPSVKSLVPFPQVLAMMNDKLDWTQQLGYAAAAQQADVLDSVQRLRRQAQTAGTLTSNDQQIVKVAATSNVTVAPAEAQPGAVPATTVVASAAPPPIIIEPANPQVVYVPSYNPAQVYGTWPYPAYPPVYLPPPPGYAIGTALATGLAFGVGVAITASLWNVGSPNWGYGYGHGSVNVNVNRYNNLNVNNINRNNFSNKNNFNNIKNNGNRYNAVGNNGTWNPRPPAAGSSGGYRRPDGPVGRPSKPNGLPANAVGRPSVSVPRDLVKPPAANRPNFGNGAAAGANRPNPPLRPPSAAGTPGASRPGVPTRPPGTGGAAGANRPNPSAGGGQVANRVVPQRPASPPARPQNPAAVNRPAPRPAQRRAGAPAFAGASQGRQASQFSARGGQSRQIDAARPRGGGGGGGARRVPAGGGGRGR